MQSLRSVRTIVPILLVGAALVLVLAATVARPVASGHGAEAAGGESAATDAGDEPAAAPAESLPKGAEAAPAQTDEEPGAEEEGAGEDAAAAEAAGEAERGRFLGIDLDDVNLAAPRLGLIVIALSLGLAAASALWPRPPLLGAIGLVALACAGYGMWAGVVAGTEQGVPVGLPMLAGFLHLGAAVLAGLALAGPPPTAHAAGHAAA